MDEPTLLQRRHRVMGNQSPLFYDQPLTFVKGEGVWLTAEDGRRYLDAYNNVPCVGHCHPGVVAAMQRQAAQVNTHTRYLNEQVVAYAERLTALHDDPLGSLMFTCTGSEANELALRMARFVTGHTGVIVSDYNYHGNTRSLAELTTAMATSEAFSAQARTVPIPCLYRAPAGTSEQQLEDQYIAHLQTAIDSLQAQGTPVAALLIDTLFANEGLPRVPAGFVARAAKLVRAAGGVLIADEVQSGFARTGEHLWGYQAQGVVPDIVTLGKPMGNGFPLAGMLTSREWVERFGRASMYFNTFGGSPVAAAVGTAVLDAIEDERLQANALSVGRYLQGRLQALGERHDLIGDVRGKGLYYAVELVQDRRSQVAASAEARQVVNRLRDQGILISKIGPNDNILKIRPPLVFSQVHADLLVDTLDRVLTVM